MSLALQPEVYAGAHAVLRRNPHPVEQGFKATLAAFPNHSLAEQDVVTLADRTDSKYLMPIEVLPLFLEALDSEYSVLQCGSDRAFTYENTYFDTPGYALYLSHHNGKDNRYKCRYRRYLETDISYLEIKLKSNKQRTVKNRMPWPMPNSAMGLPGEAPVMPALYVNYRRITLWNHSTNERLTIDYDLTWQRPSEPSSVRLPESFIAELKREGKVYGSSFVRRAKEYGFLPTGFSKYCIGMCLTDLSGDLKKNRFKPLLRQLGRTAVSGVQLP